MSPNGKRAAAVVLSAVLQVAIFPVAGPLPQWRACLAWVALVPWFAVLMGPGTGSWRDVRTMAGWSYVCGVLWYCGSCYWVFETMHQYGGLSVTMGAVVLVLFCLYLGLYHALFGLLIGVVRWGARGRSAWMAPVLASVFVAVELARARVTSFPWNLQGYSQVDNAALTAIAPWAGTYGLSFVVVLVNGAFAVWLVMRSRSAALLALGCGGLAIVLGAAGYLIHPALVPATEAAVLVQPDVLAGGKERAGDQVQVPLEQRMEALTRSPRAGMRLEGETSLGVVPRLILWPEAPANYEFNDAEFRRTLHALAVEQNATVIVDAEAIERDSGVKRGYRLYNSAAVFTPSLGMGKRYDKMHLVPFGEFTPYASLFSFASGLTEQVGVFDHGRDRSPLAADGHRYGTFICYESIFGDEIRQFVRDGADVLVNLSDDGWYGDSSAPFQHINMARMRAIENRRWLLRDTNNGITASIDPNGVVREWAPRNVQTAVVVHFGYRTERTFYTRHGDWFAYLCAGATVGLVLGALLRLWRSRGEPEGTGKIEG